MREYVESLRFNYKSTFSQDLISILANAFSWFVTTLKPRNTSMLQPIHYPKDAYHSSNRKELSKRQCFDAQTA